MPASASYDIFRVRNFAAVMWVAVSFAACASGAGGGRSTDECSDACARVDAADCGDVGSECVDACVRNTAAAECNSELGRYSDCFWSAEAYACDEERGTIAPACEEELRAYTACRSGSDGAGGAGGEAPNGAAGEAPSGAGGA